MKKLVMIISMFCLSTIAFAQGQGQRPAGGQGQRPEPPTTEEMIKTATKELNLSTEQVVEWTAIHEKYEDSLKDRKTAQESRKKMDEELNATLTEDQQAKYAKMKKSQGPPKRRD